MKYEDFLVSIEINIIITEMDKKYNKFIAIPFFGISFLKINKNVCVAPSISIIGNMCVGPFSVMLGKYYSLVVKDQ